MATSDLSFSKFIIPSGYESEQEKIALRRRLAEAFLNRGMQGEGRYGSPLQVLGDLAQELAGVHMEHQASNENAQLGTHIREDYQKKISDFYFDVNSGMSPQALVEKYQGDPMLEDALKPYVAAHQAALVNREDLGQYGNTIERKGDFIGKPIPSKPTDAVIQLPNGNWAVNPLAMAVRAYSNPAYVADPSKLPSEMPNPYGPSVAPLSVTPGSVQAPAGGAVSPSTLPAGLQSSAVDPRTQLAVAMAETHNRDFNPDGTPVRNTQSGAMYGMQVLPSTAHAPGYGVTPAQNETAAEYDRVGNDYLGAMLKKYGNMAEALTAYNYGPGNTDKLAATHGGFNLDQAPPSVQQYVGNVFKNMQSVKAPTGVVNGRPYWMINGVPYDNPEGQ